MSDGYSSEDLYYRGDFVEPQFYKKMVFEEETHTSLRLCLEERTMLEWLFEIWDNDKKNPKYSRRWKVPTTHRPMYISSYNKMGWKKPLNGVM